MQTLSQIWRNVPAVVRKPIVLIVGLTIIAFGLALLVLPGPGWVVIFLGFAALSTEFAVAERARNKMVGTLKRVMTYVRQKIPGRKA